jgi:hypothetical protein
MLASEKIHRPLAGKRPAQHLETSFYQILLKIFYLSAITVATIGWLWLLAWCAMDLIG